MKHEKSADLVLDTERLSNMCAGQGVCLQLSMRVEGAPNLGLVY